MDTNELYPGAAASFAEAHAAYEARVAKENATQSWYTAANAGSAEDATAWNADRREWEAGRLEREARRAEELARELAKRESTNARRRKTRARKREIAEPKQNAAS